MRSPSDWFYRLSSWQSVIATILLYGFFLIAVMAPQAEEMRSFAGSWGAPDGHLFYTPDKLYAEVANWGDAGRAHYIHFRLGLDPLWALTYTAFLITVTSVALRSATPADDRRRLLNLAPLIPMCADLGENAMGIALLSVYPEELPWLAWLTAATSCFKWLTLALAHLLMLYALGLACLTIARQR